MLEYINAHAFPTRRRSPPTPDKASNIDVCADQLRRQGHPLQHRGVGNKLSVPLGETWREHVDRGVHHLCVGLACGERQRHALVLDGRVLCGRVRARDAYHDSDRRVTRLGLEQHQLEHASVFHVGEIRRHLFCAQINMHRVCLMWYYNTTPPNGDAGSFLHLSPVTSALLATMQ